VSEVISVCFVCLGNICRSPTAEGIMQQLVAQAGLSDRIAVDSAGTSAHHQGAAADARSRSEALRRGVPLTSRSRPFRRADLDAFHYVIAMDSHNHADLLALATRPEQREKIALLRSFDPGSADDLDVPDPYYGGHGGFARVFDICFAGCTGLLQHIRRQHGL